MVVFCLARECGKKRGVVRPIGENWPSFKSCRVRHRMRAKVRPGIFLPLRWIENDMTKLEMTDNVETEEFIDDLSNEALDRDEYRARMSGCTGVPPCH